jgi:exosortase/archaeosortase family protein
VGLLLLGQGLLVIMGVLDHETPRLTAALLVLLGAALALGPELARRARGRPPDTQGPPEAPTGARPLGLRPLLVAALGAAAIVGVLAYNALARSDLALPEVAALAYGTALLAASPHLARKVGRTDVGTLVAYSFPLVLAPLGLWALNATIEAQAGSTPLRWYVQYGLAAPMAALLSLAGSDVATMGETVRIATARGNLFLTVGVVCAGLYAGVLFLGVFGLFAWQARTPPKRLAAYLALGLVGLHAANVVRLAMLGLVGEQWGGVALQQAHQHLGWVLFLAWTVAFWWLVLRRFEGPARVLPA